MPLHEYGCCGGCWRRLRGRGARAVLAHFEVSWAPVNVETLVREAGIQVVRVACPGWSSASRVETDGRAFIWLAAEEAPERQRFGLAHQLGHLLKHDLGRDSRDISYSGGAEETEANTFAARLLVPLFLLQEWADAHGASVARLAADFQVSKAVMALRLGRLAGM